MNNVDTSTSVTSASDNRGRRRLTLLIPIFLANRDTSEVNNTSENTNQSNSRGLLVLVLSVSNDTQTSGSEENSIEDVLNRLFHAHQPQGPPPASQKALDSLESVKIEGNLRNEVPRCTICFEDFDYDCEEIVRLPCNATHVFHRDCVSTWLKQHGTCPICRHQLPTENSNDKQEEPQEVQSSDLPPLVENTTEENSSVDLNLDLDSIFRSLSDNTQSSIPNFGLPSAVISSSPLVNTYTDSVQTQIVEDNQVTTNVVSNISQVPSRRPSMGRRFLRWLRNRLPRISCMRGSPVDN